LNATLVTSAIARLLAVDHAGLDDLALAAPAGAEGVTLVPYLAGERTPNRPDATGTLLGIRTDISREVLARAAFEGVACALLEGLDALVSAGVPILAEQLVLVGGGARSAAYRRVLASLSGRPVLVPPGDEIVSAGACLQAAMLATGSEPGSIADAWGLRGGAITEPDADPDVSREIRARFAVARG
jgi:xylulokinase